MTSGGPLPVAAAFDRLYTPGSSVFRAVVEALALPSDARVLDIGVGGAGGQLTLRHLVELFDRPVIGLERVTERADEVRHTFGDRVQIETVDAVYWSPPSGEHFDLVTVQLDLAGTAESLALLLPELLPRLLRHGGVAVLQVALRSRVGGAVPADVSPLTLEVLDSFLAENFGSFEPSLQEYVAPLPELGFEPLAVLPYNPYRRLDPIPAESGPLTSSAWWDPGIVAWLVVRYEGGSPGRAARRYRPALAGVAFSREETVAWLERLREEACEFLLPEEYVRALRSGPAPASRCPVSLLKHDIHHDFRRVVRLAEAEAEKGLHGVYFMLPAHELTAGFHGRSSTWASLREIQDMGHVLGIHVDPFELIREHGDLMGALEICLAEFSEHGLEVSTGNCHGNTTYRETGLEPSHFFRETNRGQRDGSDPPTSPFTPHVSRYSLSVIADRLGLVHWFDSDPRERGEKVGDVAYVSDNDSRITITGIPGGGARSDRFTLSEAFVEESISLLGTMDSLFLIHPQFYE